MRRYLATAVLVLGLTGPLAAAQIQGVVIDQRSADAAMKSDGKKDAVKRTRDELLNEDAVKSGYGLITDSNKYFKLDEAGSKKVYRLLRGTPGPGNLKVVVDGEVQGNMIKVRTVSML